MSADRPNGLDTVRNEVPRRRFLSGVAIAGGAVLFPGILASCAQSGDPEPTVSGSGGEATVDEDAIAAQLVAGQLFDFTTFDPWFIGAANRMMHFQIYDPVVALVDGEYGPSLAESWVFGEDGTSLTLKFREDVTFHNGDPLTAETVLANIERAKDTTIGHVLSVGAARIESAAAVDEHTVEVVFVEPLPEAVALDFFAAMFIIQPDSMVDVATAPAGTGPYRFESFKPGQELVMQARDDYWVAERPLTQTLVVRQFQDPAAQALNLEGGSIDWANGIDYDQVDSLAARDIEVSIQEVLGAFWEFSINVKQPHLADKRVRQAIAFAVDREKIAQSVFFGHSRPTSTPFTNESLPIFLESDLTRYDFDLDQAESLLKEAGAEGLSFEAAFVTSLPQAGLILEIVQADLAKIGVTVTINAMPSAEGGEYYNSRTYEIFSTASAIPPRDLSYAFSSVGNFRADENIITNWLHPEYQQLAADAALEVDPEARTALYARMRDIVMDEQPQVAISTRPNLYAFRSGVSGFEDRVGDFPRLLELAGTA